MSTPFVAEIRIFSFNFPPKGWALCNGQTLAINQNPALFALLGTTYGGNGQTTFALPNLQGRVPVHVGPGFTQGQLAGEVNNTLILTEMPNHVHTAQADAAATSPTPAGNANAALAFVGYGSPQQQPTTMAPQAVANTGGSQPHNNMQPYLVLNVCIALAGIFPSRT